MGNFVQTMGNLPIMKFVSTIGWKFHRKSDISRKASIPLTNYFFFSLKFSNYLWTNLTLIKWLGLTILLDEMHSCYWIRRVVGYGEGQYCALHENDGCLCDASHINMEAKYHQVPFPRLLNVTKKFVHRSIAQRGFAPAFQILVLRLFCRTRIFVTLARAFGQNTFGGPSARNKVCRTPCYHTVLT